MGAGSRPAVGGPQIWERSFAFARGASQRIFHLPWEMLRQVRAYVGLEKLKEILDKCVSRCQAAPLEELSSDLS